MIDVNEIEVEIRRLEQQELSYQLITKLADLYVVRDHLQKNFKGALVASYSQAQSEFLQVCSSVPIEDVLNVLDEHMECVKVLYPKEYSAILRKIKEK